MARYLTGASQTPNLISNNEQGVECVASLVESLKHQKTLQIALQFRSLAGTSRRKCTESYTRQNKIF
jgi:hypothetical protein